MADPIKDGAAPMLSDDDGETMELEPEDHDVEDADDGGAYVRVADQLESPEFYANLAEAIPEPLLNGLATRLLEQIDLDKRAREGRDKQYEEGLRRTGLGRDAPGGADFEGASKVVHPMLTEACIDYSSRVIKELMPPDGPVKDKIVGKPTQKKVDRAHRKTQHMNWQLTEQMPEFREELEQCLTQVPLGGAQYIKMYFNRKMRRATVETVYIDDMLLPFAATSYFSAERRTHVQRLTEYEFKNRIDSGMYRDVGLVMSATMPDPTRAGKANEKIEGKSDPGNNEDGLRDVYEIDLYLELPPDALDYVDGVEEEGVTFPYLVTVDENSGKICAIYRNWEEDDETFQRLDHIVEFPFIPWRGAYPIGLPQIVGGLSAAATGALRALLDSAHVSNSLTLIRLQSQNLNGQDVRPKPGETSSVEAPITVDDIRKAAMAVPFNPPSSVLFQLLGFLTEQAKGVVRTSLDEEAMDSNTNVPVGTQMSRVEQGLVVFSAVFGRAHSAMKRLLKIQHRINRFNLPDKVRIDVDGDEILVFRQDYEGPMDVIPVSDPNIFSEQQRTAQLQAVMQRSMGNPLYNQLKVEERFLKGMKIPNWEELINKPPEPKPMNAVNENVAAAMGKPIVAFPTQNHLAHIQVHVDFLMDPSFGMSPLIAPVCIGPILENVKQHVVFWYLNEYYQCLNQILGVPSERVMSEDPEVSNKFDVLLAHASDEIVERAKGAFAHLPPVIQQAMQILQQYKPPQPMDPAQAAVHAQEIDSQTQLQKASVAAGVKQKELAARQQTDEQRLQLEAGKDQSRAQTDRARLQLDAGRQQGEEQGDMARLAQEQADHSAELASRERINQEDNETALEISAREIAAGKHSNLKDGTSID